MTDKRLRSFDSRSMRNLAQYKNMTDEEFSEAMTNREEKQNKNYGFSSHKERIADKLREFESDYDITDLNSNDRDTLNSLIKATIMLENFELQIQTLQDEGVDINNLTLVDKINKMASELRKDIIKYQETLMISRKIRKSGNEESVLNYLDTLKKKANEFYEQKMSYIYCTKCKMLLGTAWFLYPNEERNTLRFYCNRVLDDGSLCNTKVIVKSKDLIKNDNRNISGVPRV